MATLTKGTNTYVTVADAVAYFALRLDAAAWEEASEDQRSRALATATLLLDSLEWEGYAVSETQSLAWPRRVVFFDPRLGRLVRTDSIPDRVANATCELAYHLLNNDGLLDDTGTVEDLSLGPILLKKLRNASVIPSQVKRNLRPLLRNGGGRTVWRAW